MPAGTLVIAVMSIMIYHVIFCGEFSDIMVAVREAIFAPLSRLFDLLCYIGYRI